VCRKAWMRHLGSQHLPGHDPIELTSEASCHIAETRRGSPAVDHFCHSTVGTLLIWSARETEHGLPARAELGAENLNLGLERPTPSTSTFHHRFCLNVRQRLVCMPLLLPPPDRATDDDMAAFAAGLQHQHGQVKQCQSRQRGQVGPARIEISKLTISL
jgi:hypothetical protein